MNMQIASKFIALQTVWSPDCFRFRLGSCNKEIKLTSSCLLIRAHMMNHKKPQPEEDFTRNDCYIVQ